MSVLGKRRRKKLQTKIDNEYGYRRYRDDDVEVKKARCGAGVWARRQFFPGELVLEIRGQLIRRDQYDGSQFVMELDDVWNLEPTIPAAYLNHSCSPNCELLQITKFTLGLISICNIERGTEISFDYRWPAVDWIPRCRCGAPNCRGWVVDKQAVKKMGKMAKRIEKSKPR